MAPYTLIDDLVPLILDAHSNWWPRDLVNLSLVSPCWLHYTRKRLYPYPIIHSWSAVRLLARTLEEDATLGSLISGIRLQPMKEEGMRGGASAEEWDGLRQLLTLEGLKRVYIGGMLCVQAERFLPMIADGENVEELDIDGSLLWERLYKAPSIVWSDNLAFQFPNLKKLRLTRVELEVEAPSVRYASPITSLGTDQVSLTGGHLVDILCDSESLEELEINTKDSHQFDEEVRLIVESCAVERLSYEVKQTRWLGEFGLAGEWRDWNKLQRLDLNGVFLDAGGLEYLGNKCKNVTELTIRGRFIRICAREWVSFIGDGRLSKLRVLGVPCGNNIPPFILWGKEDIDEIGRICVEKGINLVVL